MPGFGVAQAISDLVGLEYCEGIDTYNGHRWRWISPSPYCPDFPPSTLFITPPIVKLPPLRSRALQFIYKQTLRHDNGITFYTQEMECFIKKLLMYSCDERQLGIATREHIEVR